MIMSDPITEEPSIGGQFGEFYPFMNSQFGSIDMSVPIPFSPCGYLRSAPHYFTPEIIWDIDPNTNEPILPADSSQLELFENVLLIRDPIRQMLPSVPSWLIPTVNCPFPGCVYTFPHWISNTVGQFASDVPVPVPDPLEGTLGDCRWFLFYGDQSGLQTVSFDALLDQSMLSTQLYGTDSNWSDGISGQGWGLFLIKRQLDQADIDDLNPAIESITVQQGITQPTNATSQKAGTGLTINFDPQVTVSFHVYGAWQLLPPPIVPVPITDPITPPLPVFPSLFNATKTSMWTIFHNPLNFPLHTMLLHPFKA